MTSHDARLFRQFTRSVFDARAALLKHSDAENARFGQSTARWRVLYELSFGATSVTAIATITGYSRQAVQHLADALVAEGSAWYSADETDRRKKRLGLTEAGADTFEQMEARFDVWAERLMAQIPEDELIAIYEAIDSISRIVEEDRNRTSNTEKEES